MAIGVGLWADAYRQHWRTGGAGMETDMETGSRLFRAERSASAIEKAAAIVGALGVGLIAIATLTAIGARIAGLRSLGLIELVASLMMIVSFMPLGTAQAEGHIRMTLLTDRLNGGSKRILSLIEHVLVLALSVLLLWKSTLLSIDSIAIREGTAGSVAYPLWLIKISLPAGLLILVFRLALQIYSLLLLTGRRDGKS